MEILSGNHEMILRITSSSRTSGQDESLTIKAVVIGLFCVICFCVITPYSNHYVGNTYLASNHLPIGPLFLLICLTYVSVCLGRQIPMLRLSTGELVIAWGMMSVSASIPSKAFVEYLLPALVAVPRSYSSLVDTRKYCHG